MKVKNRETSVKISNYNSNAPKIFKEIKQYLLDTIHYKIEIEHIGSTSVPRLGGKGIIDILIITKREYMQKIKELLLSLGFKFNPEINTNPEKLFISGPYKYKEKELHIHIHMTFKGSNEHIDKLTFRDYLRKNPEEAKNYYELKKKWSLEAGQDRPKYTELKTSYIEGVLKKARRKNSGLKESRIKELRSKD